nr:MAG TPA: distal tail protein [Caudoviricetes sp.]
MAIRTYKVTLDSKNVIAPEPVYLRQGDKTGSVVIDATLMDNGSPVSLIGLTPMFKANTADGQAVIADSTGFSIVNVSGGEFTYQVPNALASVAGKINTAYFSLSDASGSESTFNVPFVVSAAIDITQKQAQDYITIIDGTLNSLRDKMDSLQIDFNTIINNYSKGDFYNKAETDSKDSATLASAKEFSSSGDSNTLTASKTYTDNSLSGIISIPETFPNLAAIQGKYPKGANGVMIAADNGHKYIWINNTWADSGVYQAVGIADHSIVQSMIKQPLTRGVPIMGLVTIDEEAMSVSCSNNFVLDINGKYVYVGTAQSISIPSGTGPIYFYVHMPDKTLHCDRNDPNTDQTTTNDDIYFAVVYQKRLHLYGTGSEVFVSYKQGINDSVPAHADLALGQLVFDRYAKKLSSTGNLAFVSKNVGYSINDPFTLAFKKNIENVTTYIFLDTISNKLVELSTNVVLDRYVHIATIYKDGIYGADTRNWLFANSYSSSQNDREPNTAFIIFNNKIPATLSSVYTGNGVTQGHLHIDAGACLTSQNAGNFNRITSNVDIDYNYSQSDVNSKGLYTLFWNSNDNSVYFDYYKHNSHDIKILSIYDGKVYGIDSKTISVNGSLNGGFDDRFIVNVPLTLEEWKQKAINGDKTNVAWLGDSTWEGYRVVDPKNIFPNYLNSMLPKVFSNVSSFDCSKGGYTSKDLYDNFDTLLSNANNIGILFIGGGLNDGSDISTSKSFLKKIIVKARSLGYTPVVATTQATAVPLSLSSSGGDWNNLQQRNFVLINEMKRRLASEMHVPLLDFEKHTHDFIELSDSKMSDMFVDYLHGMDPIHIYEANVAMAFLSPYCETILGDTIIGITNMYASSGISYNVANNPLPDAVDGFKASYKFTSNEVSKILNYEAFLPIGKKYTLSGFNVGAEVNVIIDGNSPLSLSSSGTIGSLAPGHHVIEVDSTVGNVEFYGLKISVS